MNNATVVEKKEKSTCFSEILILFCELLVCVCTLGEGLYVADKLVGKVVDTAVEELDSSILMATMMVDRIDWIETG